MKAAGECPPLFISPPVSSPCWRCGVEPRTAGTPRFLRILVSVAARASERRIVRSSLRSDILQT